VLGHGKCHVPEPVIVRHGMQTSAVPLWTTCG
jgi:hypothetical protein